MIWIIVIGVMVLSYIIQAMLQSRFNKYSQVPTSNGMTGADIARKMLRDNGITDVEVTSVRGTLTDHYNPQTKTVNLSEAVYGQRNIAAAAVAAHECGHVIQHVQGYGPLKLRSALVPVVNFSNKAVQWVLLAGVLLFAVTHSVLWLGVVLFGMSTLFSLVTLPVEINASRRAVAWLESAGITIRYRGDRFARHIVLLYRNSQKPLEQRRVAVVELLEDSLHRSFPEYRRAGFESETAAVFLYCGHFAVIKVYDLPVLALEDCPALFKHIRIGSRHRLFLSCHCYKNSYFCQNNSNLRLWTIKYWCSQLLQAPERAR